MQLLLAIHSWFEISILGFEASFTKYLRFSRSLGFTGVLLKAENRLRLFKLEENKFISL